MNWPETELEVRIIRVPRGRWDLVGGSEGRDGVEGSEGSRAGGSMGDGSTGDGSTGFRVGGCAGKVGCVLCSEGVCEVF